MRIREASGVGHSDGIASADGRVISSDSERLRRAERLRKKKKKQKKATISVESEDGQSDGIARIPN